MSLLARHARDKGGKDDIYNYGQIARVREKEVGREAIINATVGAFLDEQGVLKTFSTVEEAMREVPFNRLANYAPIDGLPEFVTAMTEHVLRYHRPGAYIGGIATPGGTGGLHSVFYNYLEPEEVCITATPCWSNYATLLSETGRGLKTFAAFDASGRFQLEACLAMCQRQAGNQRNVMLVLNTPAHNPTGFTLSDSEWRILVEGLTAIAQNGKNNVVLVLDVAYIDYAREEDRRLFRLFQDLPANFLTVVCASLSKGFTLYGFRLGLMIALAQSSEVLEDFMRAGTATARATWSNGSRPAMETMITIYRDPSRLAAFLEEQRSFARDLAARAEIFLMEAKSVGLLTAPYSSGFFIYLPTRDHAEAVALTETVWASDIYVVPLGDGVRIAICAIPIEKIPGIAACFQKALHDIRKNTP